ncbi:hypothetical protein VUR80DRAFT_2733 [Thermomyces stellatus]
MGQYERLGQDESGASISKRGKWAEIVTGRPSKQPRRPKANWKWASFLSRRWEAVSVNQLGPFGLSAPATPLSDPAPDLEGATITAVYRRFYRPRIGGSYRVQLRASIPQSKRTLSSLTRHSLPTSLHPFSKRRATGSFRV